MLSRTARSLFQLGFLIERTENNARILDVNSRMNVEHEFFTELDVWSPILEITHLNHSNPPATTGRSR